MTEPCDLSACDLAAAYADRSLSPVDAVRSVYDRMDRAEPLLAATWAVDREAALAAAGASERRWAEGAALGAVDGVPVTIKEMVATEGVPMPLGTTAGDMAPQPRDAPPAARLREAGAVIVAKTTNPDFGMLSSGLSSFHALARNPWDVALSPGGSSAGAAAAAAAGYGPLHLGTDIGGSVRLPASWCGIFALKPSAGRVPIDPPYIGRVAGPMTRTVEDAAVMMAVLSQPDARDYTALPPETIDWRALDCDLDGVRIGLMLDAGCGIALDPEVEAAVVAAARAFEAAGAVVVPVAPLLTRAMLDGLDRFWRTRFLATMEAMPQERRSKVLPYIRKWVEAARGYSAMDVYTGFDQIMAMREAGRAVMGDLDFILSPTAPVVAFPAEWASPLDDPARPFEHIAYTVPWNMTEQPAASINCGYTVAGLPIGLQIVGRRFDDLGVLRMAWAWERMRPAERPWPTPWETVA